MIPETRKKILLCGAVVFAIILMIQRQKTLSTIRGRTVFEAWKDPMMRSLFSFVPANIKWCEVLFEPEEEKIYPPLYHKHVSDFHNAIYQIRTSARMIPLSEGHTADMPEQYLTYSHLANLSFVKTICETGFNGGHSVFNYLTSNPKVHVYSFDIGVHEYARPMASYLQKTFNGRLNVTWGDSTITIPAFKKKNPNIKCDIIIVDGGHMYPVAKADLINFRPLANKDQHLLLLDDYRKDKNDDVKKAWVEQLDAGHVKPYWECGFYYNQLKGFIVGRYIGL